MLKTRKLGQGLAVSEIGLGCMTMAQVYDAADDRESLATLHRALDLGCTFWDTAEVYGPFKNEELIARAMEGRRDQVVVATKFGLMSPDKSRGGLDSRPEQIGRVVDGCLARLKTDRIDLLYQHRVDPQVPVEDVAGAVKDLIAAGKVLHFGLCEVAPATLRRAHAVQPVSALQSEYSLFERGVAARMLPTLRELGVGFVPYCPLGRGYLAGTVPSADTLAKTDWRQNVPRFQGEHFDANMRFAAGVKDLARRKGCTPGQFALAWLLHQGDDIVPIPGTKRRAYLEENAAAAALTLSRAELQEIDAFLAAHPVQGPRFTEAGLARVDV